jgi:hypothetical protein
MSASVNSKVYHKNFIRNQAATRLMNISCNLFRLVQLKVEIKT